ITLDIEKDTSVFCSTLVHLEDKVPVQLEVRYVNPRLVPNYLSNDFTLHTPHEFLSMAAPLTEAEHIIEAIMPTSLTAKLLKLAQFEPCLQIKRRTFSSKGVVSFATLTHPSSRFRIGGRFSVNNS
ncbi:MAG: UTRA domain-containing protein, partial [Psychrobium sp.]